MPHFVVATTSALDQLKRGSLLVSADMQKRLLCYLLYPFNWKTMLYEVFFLAYPLDQSRIRLLALSTKIREIWSCIVYIGLAPEIQKYDKHITYKSRDYGHPPLGIHQPEPSFALPSEHHPHRSWFEELLRSPQADQSVSQETTRIDQASIRTWLEQWKNKAFTTGKYL